MGLGFRVVLTAVCYALVGSWVDFVFLREAENASFVEGVLVTLSIWFEDNIYGQFKVELIMWGQTGQIFIFGGKCLVHQLRAQWGLTSCFPRSPLSPPNQN